MKERFYCHTENVVHITNAMPSWLHHVPGI